jgi:hypothetical protein
VARRAAAPAEGGSLDATEGGRRPPGWADLGRRWANVERKIYQRRVRAGRKDDWAEIKNGLQHYFVQFFKQRLEFKRQGFKCFQTKFELHSK